MSSTTLKHPAMTTATHADLDAFLPQVVAEKGTGAEARPGQLALAHDVLDALSDRAAFSGIAPAGTGKSFAYLSCAALLAKHGQRTLVSTELLGLQRQLVEDDLPLVARAARSHLGIELRYAALMGVANYVDPVKLLLLADQLVGGKGNLAIGTITRSTLIQAQDDLRKATRLSRDITSAAGRVSAPKVLQELALRGLAAYLTESIGARSDVAQGMDLAPGDWSLVSASADDKTPPQQLKGLMHKYSAACQRAHKADVVVTNHKLLGIEAITGGGTIIESAKSGHFHHLIVDEAHALPDDIRNAGKGQVSGQSFRTLGSTAAVLLVDYTLQRELNDYGDELSKLVSQAVKSRGSWGVLAIGPEDTDVLPAAFVAKGRRLLSGIENHLSELLEDDLTNDQERIRAKRSQGSIAKLDLGLLIFSRPNSDLARWAEKDGNDFVLKYTPVRVDDMAAQTLWSGADEETYAPFKRGAVCVSATLPVGFGMQVGVPEPKEYASPFAQALSKSAVLVPVCTDPAAEGLLGSNGRFDTALHLDWASPQVIKLVLANDGRALVVSATRRGAERYADDLRAALMGTGIMVFDQFSGRERALEQFRENERSVLVGTKSYMTGIDVPGEGLSLVVIDRPPRAQGNPLGDARVAQLQQQGMGKHDALRAVYVADAAMLLDQARGRLIRRGDDSGMVAVLDPRINTRWPVWTSPEEQVMYFKPLAEFGTRLADFDQAESWLRDRRELITLRAELVYART